MNADNEEECEMITLLSSKLVDKEWDNTKSTHETSKVVKRIIEAQMKDDGSAKIIDKHSEKMDTHEDQECGVRKIGRCDRDKLKVELFKKRASVSVCRLKKNKRGIRRGKNLDEQK